MGVLTNIQQTDQGWYPGSVTNQWTNICNFTTHSMVGQRGTTKNSDVHVPLSRLIEGATSVAAARRLAPGIRVKEPTKTFSEGQDGNTVHKQPGAPISVKPVMVGKSKRT